MTRYLAILNPAAGGGRCAQRAEALFAQLRQRGVELEVLRTERPGHASEMVRRHWLAGQRHFIAVGGDGTSYEVVNGLFPAAQGATEPPVLGILPAGTGNSFLRDFSDQGADYALEKIVAGESRPVDLIRLRHDTGQLFYMNLLSMGFVARVGDTVNRRFKPFGELGYVFGVVTEVARLKHRAFPFADEGADFERAPVAFLSINNSRFTGGQMMMAPHADPSDGQADLIVAGAMSRGGLLSTFPKIFKGTHVDHPLVSERQVRKLRFEIDGPVALMIDGEVLHHRPVELEVVPQALQVLV